MEDDLMSQPHDTRPKQEFETSTFPFFEELAGPTSLTIYGTDRHRGCNSKEYFRLPSAVGLP